MAKLLGVFALANVALGVLYAFSAGPFISGEDGIMPARELVSSGGDNGFIISLALLSFVCSLIAAVVCVAGLRNLRWLLSVYGFNHVAYAFLLFLADLDTPLAESVKFGDWQLLLGLGVPVSLLVIYLAVYVSQNACKDPPDGCLVGNPGAPLNTKRCQK